MKKIFFLISIAFLFITNVHAQTYVTIPDVNFRAALKVLYPSCFNVSDELDITCSNVVNATYVSVSNKSISSIEGIQYFTKIETIDCSANNITVLENLPSSLKNLLAGNNRIETILEFPENLTYIEIQHNLITNLPSFPDQLNYFSANFNEINSLPEFPSTLQRLFVGYNNLTVIPTFPEGMYDIVCDNNQLTSLPNIPSSLSALFCGSNFLRDLPPIPDQTLVSADKNCFTSEYINSIVIGSMVTLSPNRTDCNPETQENFVVIPDTYFRAFLKDKYPTCFNANDEMDITCLSIVNEIELTLGAANVFDIKGIEYFVNLKKLDVNFNGIRHLSNLPEGITYLDCSYNDLESISSLPPYLTYLDCSNGYSSFQSLPILPSTLTYLDCSHNQYLMSVPDLPQGLLKLDCNTCNLETLPRLPNSLTHLYCYENKLTGLPSLPANLIYLDCSNNYLTDLPTVSNSNSRVNSTQLALPDNLEYLNASGNCFDEAVGNPNPAILTTFIVSPNRSNCSLTTGINTTAIPIAANVYPNPANDKIIISVSKTSTIKIYNSTGQLMIQKNISDGEELKVSSFIPGVYYYSIDTVSGKLIIE